MGRCTTETVWGNSIFIHWTNYLWEWVRGISQHPLSLSFSPCLSFSANNSGKKTKKNMRGIISVWKHIKIGIKNEASLTFLISGMSVYSEIKNSNRSFLYILFSFYKMKHSHVKQQGLQLMIIFFINYNPANFPN